MLVKPFVFKRPRVELVPLIDMFFLLLAFFIFGVFSMTLQQGIVVDLPRAKTASVSQEPALTISLSADGALALDHEPITLDALAGALQQEQRRRRDALVVINADRQVAHGVVIAVLDAVRGAGLLRVSFQTAPEGTPEGP